MKKKKQDKVEKILTEHNLNKAALRGDKTAQKTLERRSMTKTKEEKVLTDAVVCYLVSGDKVWLAFKTEKIGKDCWNGWGGGIEKDETPEAATVREVEQEARVRISSEHLVKVALIGFYNKKTDGGVFVCRVHFYFCHRWKGKPQPTKEMATPALFKKGNLPLLQMMPADRIFVPVIMAGIKIKGKASYGPFQKKLLGPVEIEEVNSFEER